jgi:hypothetical protein
MRYLITLANGGVAIGGTRTLSLAETLAKWELSARPEWLPATIAEFSGTLPTTRTFRAAWKQTGANVLVDMPAARVIHMDRIRAARDQALEKKDKEQLQALGRNDQAERARLEAEKVSLRNLPTTVQGQVNAAGTPEALEAIWPPELPARP